MLLAVALDDQNLVRALEVLVVALVWLFFLRVIRAVWVEVRPPKARAGAATMVASAPPAPAPGRAAPDGRGRRLRLRIVEPEDARGRDYEVPDEVTVGRAAGCGVRVDDAYTSSLHARLFRRDGALWVEDLGSTNGTFVNSHKVTAPVAVRKGDRIQFGRTTVEVRA